jgi:hypothetical protein
MNYRAFAASVAAVSAVSAAANACLVNFNYQGSGSNPAIFAAGSIDVTGTSPTSGSITLSGTGAMDGVYMLVANGGSNGSFVWDNYFDLDTAPHITNGGLLFVNGNGDQINVFNLGVNSYALYGNIAGHGANDYSTADEGGILQIVPVPTPGAFALVGLAGLISKRRRA